MNNPFSTLTKKEWLLWLCSLFIVLVSNILAANFDPLTLIAALVGVTSLVFAAKGNVWAQVLMIVFSILYGIISFRFRYWGEMITYLGMALPMAVWSAITWLRHPAESGDAVAIQKLNLRQFAGLLASCVVVTVLFYRILAALDTPNLAFSTLSVITSFLAAALTMLRSSYYALGYAANDVVLIVLWLLASLTIRGIFRWPSTLSFSFLMICTALSVGKSAKFCKLKATHNQTAHRHKAVTRFMPVG